VDPDTPESALSSLKEPIKPTPADTISTAQAGSSSSTIVPLTVNDLDDRQFRTFNLLNRGWELEFKQYEKKKLALAQLKTRINESIKREYLTYTLKADTTYHALVNLKNRFAPSDDTIEEDLMARWDKLQKLSRGQDIGLWLQEWETTFDDCKERDMPETNGTRPLRAFVKAVSQLEPGFTNYWNNKFSEPEKKPAFKDLVQRFREFRRIRQGESNKTGGGTHGTFAATLQGRDKDGNEQKKKCLCGGFHLYADCYYLIESKRPKGWNPNPEIQKKVEKMIENPFWKKRIESILKKVQGKSDSDSVLSKDESANPIPNQAYVADTTYSVSSQMQQVDFDLSRSYILDSGSTIHVCNNRSRFIDFRPAGDSDFLIAGQDTVQI
jgi:hypothetical protein